MSEVGLSSLSSIRGTPEASGQGKGGAKGQLCFALSCQWGLELICAVEPAGVLWSSCIWGAAQGS